jgi:predicted AAA+ superfamily ATPase
MTKIITKANTDEIAARIVEFLAKSPRSLIRIEGVCGSGKTTISRKLAANGVGLHVEIDKFATKPSKPAPYAQCLRQAELDSEIARAIQTNKTVILDAVCLEEVAPVVRWGRGLRIYVSRALGITAGIGATAKAAIAIAAAAAFSSLAQATTAEAPLSQASPLRQVNMRS